MVSTIDVLRNIRGITKGKKGDVILLQKGSKHVVVKCRYEDFYNYIWTKDRILEFLEVCKFIEKDKVVLAIPTREIEIEEILERVKIREKEEIVEEKIEKGIKIQKVVYKTEYRVKKKVIKIKEAAKEEIIENIEHFNWEGYNYLVDNLEEALKHLDYWFNNKDTFRTIVLEALLDKNFNKYIKYFKKFFKKVVFNKEVIKYATMEEELFEPFYISAYEERSISGTEEHWFIDSSKDKALERLKKKLAEFSNKHFVVKYSDFYETLKGWKGWFSSDDSGGIEKGYAVKVWYIDLDKMFRELVISKNDLEALEEEKPEMQERVYRNLKILKELLRTIVAENFDKIKKIALSILS